MTTTSALDILPALVNPPFCYKLGVSAIKDYTTCTYEISRSLHQAPVRPLCFFFFDLVEHREPAKTKRKKEKKDYVYLWWIIYLLASCRFFFSRLQFCLRACYMLEFGVEFWYRWICFLVPYWGGTLASCFTNIKLLIFQSLFSLIIKQFAGVFCK